MNRDQEHHLSEYYPHPLYPEPIQSREIRQDVLPLVLARAKEVGSHGTVVCDIDFTIYDNKPREARILREFGEQQGIQRLTQCKPEYVQDRSLARTMMNCGLDRRQAEALDTSARAFWLPRFLSNEYCLEDRPLPGAVTFLRTLQDTGVCIVYCTGRPKLEMEQGTLDCLRRDLFPIPDGKQVFLLMKPTLEMSDDESKEFLLTQLKKYPKVVAAFDNEPLHINGYHQAFPDALCVHLLTEESGRGIPVLPSIPSVKNFIY